MEQSDGDDFHRRVYAQLEADEDRRKHVYKDHLGYWTIGIGRLVDSRKPGSGLRDSEIDLMLRNDVAEREMELSLRLSWYKTLDPVRRAAVLMMSFQLGVEGLLKFHRTLRAIADERWHDAREYALQSLWAKQTPARAKRIANMLATGEW